MGFSRSAHFSLPAAAATTSQDASRISGDHRIGRDILGDDASGADHGVFADGHIGQNRGARSDGSALPYQSGFHFPVLLGLQTPVLEAVARG